MPNSLAPDELAKLVKCLALTASSHDGEALAAIRKANAILARLKVHWVEVFTHDERPRTYSETVDAAFDFVLATTRPGTFRDLIEKFWRQWSRTGTLSPKQAKILFDAEARQRQWVADHA